MFPTVLISSLVNGRRLVGGIGSEVRSSEKHRFIISISRANRSKVAPQVLDGRLGAIPFPTTINGFLHLVGSQLFIRLVHIR